VNAYPQGAPDAASAPVSTLDLPRALRDAFRHALKITDLSEKAAAIMMGIDQAQLSRGLSGEGHLYLDRIPVLGSAFQIAFVTSWAEALDLRIVVPDPARENLRALLHQMLDHLALTEGR
jgi:hypothetical protein